jgi:hypothetical protein
MAQPTLHTLTVTQILERVRRRTDDTWRADIAAGFFEGLENEGLDLDLDPDSREIVARGLATVVGQAIRATLELLAGQDPPVIVVPDPPYPEERP